MAWDFFSGFLVKLQFARSMHEVFFMVLSSGEAMLQWYSWLHSSWQRSPKTCSLMMQSADLIQAHSASSTFFKHRWWLNFTLASFRLEQIFFPSWCQLKNVSPTLYCRLWWAVQKSCLPALVWLEFFLLGGAAEQWCDINDQGWIHSLGTLKRLASCDFVACLTISAFSLKLQLQHS